jgi:acetoin utilization protein AcuC
MKSAFLYSEFFSHYDFGALHPFKTTRAQIVYELCRRYNLLESPWIEVIKPEPLPFDQLTLFHDSEYLVLLQAASSKAFAFEMLGCGLGTDENPIIEGLYTLLSLSAGATYRGAELLAQDEFTLAFNVFGGFHHAGRAHAEGFCYINDVGIALSYLIEKGLKVACIDLDAHHGNGVQDAFYGDNRVLKISLHESGKTLYPWSGFETEIGEGGGKGYNINIPLPQGTDDETYLYAFFEIVPPVMKAFSPDITIGVFGADTHKADPLTHLNMSNYSLCRAVKTIGELSPKVLALGAGGYNVYNSARTWSLLWATLNNIQPEDAYLGAVGGMMYGPEAESGSLEQDPLLLTSGAIKETTQKEVERVVNFIKGSVFSLWGI